VEQLERGYSLAMSYLALRPTRRTPEVCLVEILGSKTTLSTTGGATCATLIPGFSGTNKQIGAALGGGVEYGISQNLSAKLEYLYITAASLDISHHSEIRALALLIISRAASAPPAVLAARPRDKRLRR
jgi:opacity protein-like surface antigen